MGAAAGGSGAAGSSGGGSDLPPAYDEVESSIMKEVRRVRPGNRSVPSLRRVRGLGLGGDVGEDDEHDHGGLCRFKRTCKPSWRPRW